MMINLKFFLIKALTEHKWFGVFIKDYLFSILEYTDNKIYNDEMLLFVRHAGVEDYDYSSAYDIAKLILIYRRLKNDEKEKIKKFAKQQFEKTDSSKSKTSWGNMAGNGLKDLINDFSNFDEIIKHQDYLELKI